jgi:hypothetical protein
MNIKLNVKAQPTIIFCLPASSFSGKWFDSFIYLLDYCNNHGINYMISRHYSPVIYYVRTMCLGGDVLRGPKQKPFNGKVDYTHLMWIDSDIIFTPEHFQKLLDHNKNIISGIYMMSNGKQFATVENWDEEYFKANGHFHFMTERDIKRKNHSLIEVDYTGLGFMLVKKGVFESLDYPWFQPKFYDIGNCRDFSSEDVSFCEMIKEKGFKIYVDTDIRVRHEKLVLL